MTVNSVFEEDLPKYGALLNDIDHELDQISEVVKKVDSSIDNELSNHKDGLDLFGLKNSCMSMYLTDLLNVVGCQLSGVSISGSPLVDRLIEERVVMERIKPLEDKISYKTEKLTKMASGKMAKDDPLNQKPADIDDIDFGSDDEEMEDEEQTTKKSTGKYVIPKNRQAFYDEPGTDKAEERRKKKAIRGAIADELMKDTDEPEEINTGELHQSGKMSARLLREEKEKKIFEEAYMTRTRVEKRDRMENEAYPDDFPEEQRAGNCLFFCRLSKANILLQLLKGLMINPSCMVSFVINESGISIVSEFEACIESTTDMKRALFEELTLPERVVKFCVQGSDLTSALSLVQLAAVEISQVEENEPLLVKLIEDGMTVDVHIQVFDVDAQLSFEFDNDKEIPRFVLNARSLREAIENWDVIGASTKIVMSPDAPHFSFISKGLVGKVRIDFAEELLNEEMDFQCKYYVARRYRTDFMKAVLTPSKASTRVAFRIDKNGLLHVKHMVTVSTNELSTTDVFLNFVVNSEVLLDGEGDGDENEEPFEETVCPEESTHGVLL
ncbi:Oidioi.mRNA.OKI2018_I69.chr1.g3315.t1.cds [Oikopleura dioica]|uniref:Oidioi.mRNA.OKI2018_I69.chr1.g3315.t1.cds n=1 Tax=Oikopleura dioica TaxID=34765 RepID=A0ABN7T0K1_OIKDI|nr:Oidioi.mRNA.OKI2018_I69.chr1.g3315.t1.cds [Oikopleura dioica]